MPAVIKPTPAKIGVNRDLTVKSSPALLQASSKTWTANLTPNHQSRVRTNKKVGVEDRRVLQSSFDNSNGFPKIVPYPNGLVDGIIRAFNQDLHLILRPDDIWTAILTQFSMYVNGHAEELRHLFVAHQDKKRMVVDFGPFSLEEVDIGKVAHVMTTEVQKHVIDAELQSWMIPSFSTTTPNDVAVSSVIMLGSLQAYFEYVMVGGCGFPSVTLLGESTDWEDLVVKARKLPRYGPEAEEWSRLLIPILQRMVQSFQEPDSAKAKDFWLRTCYEAGADGSGSIATLSGWITAICFWDEHGKKIKGYSDETIQEVAAFSQLTLEERRPLIMDGIKYPILSPKEVPNSFVTVPVQVKDFGEMMSYDTTMIAGSVGMTFTEHGTTVQPISGWWMLVDRCGRFEPNDNVFKILRNNTKGTGKKPSDYPT